MNIRPGIELANLSDIGCQRTENEDYYCYAEPEADEDFQKKGRLAVVADGMGGHEGGQVASGIAVDKMRQAFLNGSAEDPHEALLAGLQDAQAAIKEYARENPELSGMGTTCTALVLRGRQLYFAHVGDSRLYLVRNARILRLTRDHSYVGRLVESGIVRAEDAEKHPQRHILTAALGAGRDVAVDGAEHGVALLDGDDLLLCTDGLWSVVTEEELETAVSGNAPAECCAALVKLARQRGGTDNITLQVLRVGPESQA